MSEMVTYRGTLKEIYLDYGQTYNVYAMSKLSRDDIKNLDSYYDGDAIECLCDIYYNDYIFVNDKLYKIVSMSNQDREQDIFEATMKPDGTIDYLLQYYNGGCGFGEAIEEALDNIRG